MNYGRFFFITIKRYLKKPGFLILLFLMLTFSLFLKFDTKEQSSGIEVAFFCDSTKDGERLISRLEDYEGLFHFECLESEEAVYTMVGRGNYECGYLLPDDLLEELLSGNHKEQITVVTSPSTTMAVVINETVYSLVFEELAKDILLSYLKDSSVVSDSYGTAFSSSDVLSLYELYRNNGSTFRFDYDGAPKDYQLSVTSILLSPTRGLIAVFVLLGGFSSVLSLYKEEKNPLFNKTGVKWIHIITPMLLLSFCGFLILLILNIPENLLFEFFTILGYLILCSLFLRLLHKIIKSQTLFATLIPVYVLGCLIFTPVFFNISLFIPALKPVSYFFLPYYYLAFVL